MALGQEDSGATFPLPMVTMSSAPSVHFKHLLRLETRIGSQETPPEQPVFLESCCG